MKVMVTGGAGFIGSHIVDACVTSGHDVFVLDDLSTGKRDNVNPQARLYAVDLTDDAELNEVMSQERPEVISHQAAKANVRESMIKPRLYAQVNIIGSLNLLEAARRHGVRKVVYASTGGAVYGEPEYLPADEDHPIEPLDPYGASKHHVEHYLSIYRKHFGIDYTILRYANIYGPRQDPLGEAGVVAIWAAQMLKGEKVTVYGSGEQERDFVYVGDVARANVLALTQGSGEILNLGSSIPTSISQVFELLKASTGYTGEAFYEDAKQGEVFRTYITNARAKAALGWQPSVSLQEGLELTVAHFRERM